MTKLMMFAATGLIFAVELVPVARAQVTIDLSKVTCDQYVGYKITDPRNIAMWLSGYHNGRRGNTIIDTQVLAANAKRLQDYCLLNPATPVMQAAETLFSVQHN